MAKLIIIDKNGNIKSKRKKGKGKPPAGFVKNGDDYYLYEHEEKTNSGQTVDPEASDEPLKPKKTKIYTADNDQIMDFETVRNCLKDVGVIEKSEDFMSLQSPIVYRHMLYEPILTYNSMYERINLDLANNKIDIWIIIYGGKPDITIENAFKKAED